MANICVCAFLLVPNCAQHKNRNVKHVIAEYVTFCCVLLSLSLEWMFCGDEQSADQENRGAPNAITEKIACIPNDSAFVFATRRRYVSPTAEQKSGFNVSWIISKHNQNALKHTETAGNSSRNAYTVQCIRKNLSGALQWQSPILWLHDWRPYFSPIPFNFLPPELRCSNINDNNNSSYCITATATASIQLRRLEMEMEMEKLCRSASRLKWKLNGSSTNSNNGEKINKVSIYAILNENNERNRQPKQPKKIITLKRTK